MDGKFYIEHMTYRLTKYINKRLKDDNRIVSWAFYISEENTLVVVIDYIYNYHSRLQIPINESHDFDENRMMFDHYMVNYFHELEALMKGDK